MARPDPLVASAVFTGGAAGTGLRWLLDTLLVEWLTGPWVVVGINIVGAFLLGLLMGRSLRGRGPGPLGSAFFATGFLGGFTTYSAFAGGIDSALRNGDWFTAAAQLVATAGVGVAAAWWGLRIGRLK